LGLITGLVVAADLAAVVYVEKILAAGTPAHAGHRAVPPATPKEMILTGLVIGLPVLIIVLMALLRGRGKAPAAPARPGYPFRSGL